MSSLVDVALAYCAVNGHRFVTPVGSGAFKETFHIVLATGEQQALKVFQPGYSPERTSRELSAMQRCSHPNIARLTAIAGFYHDGIQYLLSLEEFLSGGTLTDRYTRGLLARSEALAIGNQLVNAISHIAARDLVHRDIKPDNIPLSRGWKHTCHCGLWSGARSRAHFVDADMVAAGSRHPVFCLARAAEKREGDD